MITNDYKPVVIGVGGFARAGKDTFVKVAKKILKENGYSSIRLAFADTLKEEIDNFLIQHYAISAWTDDAEQKKIIRPYLVAHGCGKRMIGDGKYWIDRLDAAIKNIHFNEDVIFISDCRFPNEADWIHNNWGGWFVHLRKYSLIKGPALLPEKDFDGSALAVRIKDGESYRFFDKAPNEEEAYQDPLCAVKADYHLDLENTIERELRITGNKITSDSLIDNSYLIKEITICLSKCPFLTIQTQ